MTDITAEDRLKIPHDTNTDLRGFVTDSHSEITREERREGKISLPPCQNV